MLLRKPSAAIDALAPLAAEWCPTQDKFLDVKYDEESVAEGKAFAKATLQVCCKTAEPA